MNDQINDIEKDIKKQIEQNISINKEILNNYTGIIKDISHIIINAYRNDKQVLWMGNGGSAADAQHLSCEFVSKFKMDRDALKSIALTTNTSLLTALSNDYGYENVFARQVQAIAEEKDILIGITTSGKSQNILDAFKIGKKKGTINIAFTGIYTDKIKKYVDYLIAIPSEDTPRIQESHILIGHIICDIVEKTLFGEYK